MGATSILDLLEVTSGGAIMIRAGDLVDRFIVPAPQDASARPVVGDGWTLKSAPRAGNWTVSGIES